MRAAIDEQRLSLWMQAHVAGFPRPPARFEIQQFTHGQSNPTFLVVADGRKFVVRKKPAGALLPGAHQVEREYRVMMALVCDIYMAINIISEGCPTIKFAV